MKQIILMIAVVALVGCSAEEGQRYIETGEMPKSWEGPPKKSLSEVIDIASLEKGPRLSLIGRQLTKVPMGVEKLTQLKELELSHNKLTSVEGLEKLPQLRVLYLDYNKLTELPQGLEKLTQLTKLSLKNHQLTNLKGLEKLTKLEVLFLETRHYLPKAQIDELQKALPKCRIHHSNPKK
jgi:hypothetical protein